ncbi:hypothetical protein DelCs14_1783 [Delftia sp. Cs1-4]|uniref:type IV toxin-antitoxin system AbiEi family antitoxin domain-containing protein n=1 Tax=Delftia sp. (strain Cs1-4) TaxID=742013 RepID=UPI00020E7BDA|nr:type IV toxin-antitoxin system AbiEi family antitoxin domain-containing protein [Delftia sp. Cs1-4]AEF88809.1 hypothetical protein DelCs14_1783 [Delftia sp. Cs1-4]
MKLGSKLLVSLGKRSGNVVQRRELAEIASASHLSEAIGRLVEAGRLVRLGAGFYAKARPDNEGKGRPLAGPVDLVREVFEKLGVPLRTVSLVTEDGHLVLLVDPGGQRIARKLDIAGTPVRYVKGTARRRAADDVMPLDPDALPTKGVSRFVERFARAHGIAHLRTGLDDYAEAVTRTAGDDVVLDATGKLLAALKKKDLINGRQLARLMTNHMREVKHVRSVRRLRKRGLSAQH